VQLRLQPAMAGAATTSASRPEYLKLPRRTKHPAKPQAATDRYPLLH
jgi:hypothetical protein